MSISSTLGFPVEKLNRIDFGALDAAQDALIKENLCVCHIKSLKDFLRGKATILVGERGTGKTAIFELLRSGRICFSAPENTRHSIIAISDSLDYKVLRKTVETSLKAASGDEILKYRAVWEVFLLRHIAQKVKAEFQPGDGLLHRINAFEACFIGAHPRPTLVELLLLGKKKVGIKFDVSALTGTPTADVYAQVSSDDAVPAQREDDRTAPEYLMLGELKAEIDQFLRERRVTFVILVDRIDEFVVREEYEVQRAALNGLLSAEKSYLGLSNIKLKLFLRADLFAKLDLRESGADKIHGRLVELRWQDEEIREFLAKRILYNYLAVHGVSRCDLQYNAESIYLDARSNVDAARGGWKYRSRVFVLRKIGGLIVHTVGRWVPCLAHMHHARHANLNDSLNRFLIEAFIGSRVVHYDADRVEHYVGATEYLVTHFHMNGGASTPRVMLMFIDECVVAAIDYYAKNSIREGVVYPIVPEFCFPEAYMNLKEKLWGALAQEGRLWQNQILTLKRELSCREFTAADVRAKLAISDNQSLEEFLAVLNHLGILACLNRSIPADKRVYNLPLLFMIPQEQSQDAAAK